MRGEQVQTKTLREQLGDQLALDAVTGFIQTRREYTDGALAGSNGDNATTDPAFARQADFKQPVTRLLVKTGGGQRGQHTAAIACINDPFLGERIHPATGQSSPHHGEVLGRDI